MPITLPARRSLEAAVKKDRDRLIGRGFDSDFEADSGILRRCPRCTSSRLARLHGLINRAAALLLLCSVSGVINAGVTDIEYDGV